MANRPSNQVTRQLIEQAHNLYCQLTGQKLSMGYYRERLWCDLLREGYRLEDIRQVITYLQKEIRHGRRNIGALKLSNLLQPDRFDEDYNLMRIKLSPPSPPKSQSKPKKSAPQLDPKEQERRRQHALNELQRLRQNLNLPPRQDEH